MKNRLRDPVGQSPEERIRKRIKCFAKRSLRRIREFPPQEFIEGNYVNPLLMWALGINDFGHLAKYLVYRTLDRSFVTSFGYVIQDMIEIAANGQKGTWWDVVKETPSGKLYLCVKSGGSNMNKDLVEYYSKQVIELMAKDPDAIPMIAMGYGRRVWPIINKTLNDQGLDPEKHTVMGKVLFDKITGDPNFHKNLPKIIEGSAVEALSGKRIIDLIDQKIDELKQYLTHNYRDTNELLQYIFDPQAKNL